MGVAKGHGLFKVPSRGIHVVIVPIVLFILSCSCIYEFSRQEQWLLCIKIPLLHGLFTTTITSHQHESVSPRGPLTNKAKGTACRFLQLFVPFSPPSHRVTREAVGNPS